VAVSPFGWGRSPSWEPVDDLIVLGAGGLLQLGGYPDIGPIAPYGGQSHLAAGIFAAVAAMVGLIEREQTGVGSSADVSAQEAVAQALEDSLPAYVLTGEIREPQGEDAREAGTGVYACNDGFVSMVAGRLGTAKAWAAMVAWLNESGLAASELLEPQWAQFAFRQTAEASERFRQIFELFASTRTKEFLYLEAQRRGIALSPVSNVDDLLANEQLRSRSFFHTYFHPGLGIELVSPGPPYRFSDLATIDLGPASEAGSDTAAVLSELGVPTHDYSALGEGGMA
jgi:benzylsuccinate CoA-transferase BbsE subunit